MTGQLPPETPASVSPASDIVFSPAVKALQAARGSRSMFEAREAQGGFRTEISADLAAFISSIVTCYLATAAAHGQPSVQHRGGPPGFLRVLDVRTLAFADFAGNQQYVSLGNLSENPKVALILMDYENRRRVKIWGTASVVTDDKLLLAGLFPRGYRARAQQAIIIKVTAWDINCSQHIPEMFHAARVAETLAEMQARIDALVLENAELKSYLKRELP
jgi:uncharacterized protein